MHHVWVCRVYQTELHIFVIGVLYLQQWAVDLLAHLAATLVCRSISSSAGYADLSVLAPHRALQRLGEVRTFVIRKWVGTWRGECAACGGCEP